MKRYRKTLLQAAGENEGNILIIVQFTQSAFISGQKISYQLSFRSLLSGGQDQNKKIASFLNHIRLHRVHLTALGSSRSESVPTVIEPDI